MKILGLILLMVCMSTFVNAENTYSDQAILGVGKTLFPSPQQSVSIEGNRLIISDNSSYVSGGDPLSIASDLYGLVDGAKRLTLAYPGRFDSVELRWLTIQGELKGVLAVQVNPNPINTEAMFRRSYAGPTAAYAGAGQGAKVGLSGANLLAQT